MDEHVLNICILYRYVPQDLVWRIILEMIELDVTSVYTYDQCAMISFKFGSYLYGYDKMITEHPHNEFVLSPGVDRVARGTNHIIILRSGSVWASGLNSRGQLGIGKNLSGYNQVMINLSNVVEIYAKDNYSMALTKTGVPYIWGDTLVSNNCIYCPYQIDLNDPIKSIACFVHHILFLSVTGNVFGLGYSDVGQLGIPDRTMVPVKLGLPGNIISVAGGFNFSLALSSAGKLYGTGYNKNWRVKLFCGLGRMRQFKDLGLKNIVSVSSNDETIMILNKDFSVYLWGHNQYDLFGLGTYITEPTKVNLGLLRIKSVHLGEKFSLLITKNNEVYDGSKRIAIKY